jgi:hypothetical protein
MLDVEVAVGGVEQQLGGGVELGFVLRAKHESRIFAPMGGATGLVGGGDGVAAGVSSRATVLQDGGFAGAADAFEDNEEAGAGVVVVARDHADLAVRTL